MSTPHLYLRTALILDNEGRIISTREPDPSRGPMFTLVRSATSCAWAVRADLPTDLASELDRLAREEPSTPNLRDTPVHAERYRVLLGGRQADGPGFTFPQALVAPHGIVQVEDERLLQRHFRGWTPGEIEAGRSPVLSIVEDGYPVSVCFCARRSDAAAEAGVETAEAFRGRGFGPQVTAAWAAAIRASGRVPLYSTAWANDASLSLARKLGLIAYANIWSLSD
jgi:hypothetical protein